MKSLILLEDQCIGGKYFRLILIYNHHGIDGNEDHHDDDHRHHQDDDQGEGDVFEDRRGKMSRTTSSFSLQPTLWQRLLFQV